MGKEQSNILLQKGFIKRTTLFNDPDTDCFRIFNSSGDGIDGLTVDYYNGYLLVQFFRKSVEERLETILREIKNELVSVPAEIKGILVKNRIARSEQGGDAWKSVVADGAYPGGMIVVRQNGIKMYADLVNGQNTGVFLDMREIRMGLTGFYKTVRPVSMLNLFCYTGAFSLHGLCNGVERAVNVDLSKSVLKKAKSNYSLNNLNIDDRDFIFGDSYDWVKIFAKKNIRFDFAVFDPPTFSRNRDRNFSVRHDYPEFLKMLESVVPEGHVFTSINSNSLTKKEYLSFHPSGWELIMFANESSDFIHGGNPYLKTGLWKI